MKPKGTKPPPSSMRRMISLAPVGCSMPPVFGVAVGAEVGVGFGVAGGVVGPVVGPPVDGAVGAGVAPWPTLQAEISAAKASAGRITARFRVRVGSAEEFDMGCLTK